MTLNAQTITNICNALANSVQANYNQIKIDDNSNRKFLTLFIDSQDTETIKMMHQNLRYRQ